jgi:hypothetical protein
MQFVVGPLVLFGALAIDSKPPPRAVLASIAISFLVFAGLELASPSLYGHVASSLLDRFFISDGHRGVSLLTPEPTYASISAAYFLMLALWSGGHWGFRYRWIEPALVACLLATGSTYMVLITFLLGFLFWPRFCTVVLAVALGISLLFAVDVASLSNDSSIRLVVAYSRLFSADMGDFFASVSHLDSSVGSRLSTAAASFLSVFNHPFGLGLLCGSLATAFSSAGFDFVLQNEVLAGALEAGRCLKAQSYVTNLMLAFGVFSFLFAVLLISLIKVCSHYSGRRVWFAPLALAGLMLIVQSQLTSPIPWLLIAIAVIGLNGSSRHSLQTVTLFKKGQIS